MHPIDNKKKYTIQELETIVSMQYKNIAKKKRRETITICNPKTSAGAGLILSKQNLK